jgi:type IV pilus assembly protein PilB
MRPQRSRALRRRARGLPGIWIAVRFAELQYHPYAPDLAPKGRDVALDERVATRLLEASRITSEQLGDAKRVVARDKTSLGAALVRLGALSEVDYAELLGTLHGVPFVDLGAMQIPAHVVGLVPGEVASKFQVLPIARSGRQLTLAMADPSNIFVVDDIKFITGLEVTAVVCTDTAMKKAIDQYYDSADALASVMAEMDEDVEVVDEQIDEDSGLAGVMDDDAPVVKLVNSLLSEALRRGASDIHIEPYEGRLRVRYRVDGVLAEIMNPPFRLKNAVISRLKIMSELDIAERRVPQDGRIKIKIRGKKVDVRVSTVPTIFGEKVVMRILDASNLQLDLKKLGFDDVGFNHLVRAIDSPYGMVLVTGPTGSGKTTTLYSALARLNTTETNIMTAEDPVEYNLEGINQVLINEDIGLTFSAALKAFLRQDPNIVMVGEVRDLDTASIAVKAALTGHMVLSTVHTNDTSSTINRLVDMGIEPFLVASSLNLILAQRLARRICKKCKQERGMTTPEILIELGLDPKLAPFMLYAGAGCVDCNMSGYAGRLGLYEILPMTPTIKEMILERASSMEIKRVAMENGMVTLRGHGIMKIREGLTSVEEVLKETTRDDVDG